MKNFNLIKTTILMACLWAPIILYGQDKIVSGKVLDTESDTPLPGVSIIVKGTSQGTTTDIEGNYSLNVPGDKNTLIFSFIGYATEEVNIQNQSVVNVNLTPDVTALQEVVVIGYGEQQKSLLTGAISSIDAEQISNTSTLRVEQALQGRTAGVNVLSNSGSPGSGLQVRIRGTGSNGNSSPLYIVDGIRTGGIEYLDPSEIASIEVLKDAASAAIYGAEGANGVVLITTKTGKRGKAQINYNFQYGIQSVGQRMEMMNAEEYAIYINEAGASGTLPDPADYKGVQGTDWLDELFQSAALQKHSLNFSGGSENSTYLVGGSFYTQDGVAGGDKAQFDRYTARLNSDHNINDWLKVGNRLSYSHFKRSTIAEDTEFGSVVGNAILMDPTTPVVYTNGLPAHAQTALDAGETLTRDENGNYYGISQFVQGEIGNPLAMIENSRGDIIQDKVVGNVFAEITPVKNIKFTSRFGIDAAFQLNHTWFPSFFFSNERKNDTPTVRDTNEKWFTTQWENFATYTNSIGNHDFSVLLGTSSINYTYNRLNGSGGPMFDEEDKYAYYDYVPDGSDLIGSNKEETSLLSYFGRLSYTFGDKYLLNATFRYDGSSLLPEGNRWDLFPSVSAGWVISSEDFFPSTFVSFMKLRASWGENGNLRSLSPGQYASIITTQGIRYPNGAGGFYVGAEPDFLPNPDLVWETSEQIDLGLDFGLLDDQLRFTVDYYNKTTKGLLTPSTPPHYIGNDGSTVNGGDIRNKGFEFEATYTKSTGAFTYEISANLTTINNEVTYLNPLVPDKIQGAGVGTGWTATYFEEGLPIWYFRGYQTAGIFQSQEHIDSYISQNGISDYNPSPGEPIVVDVTGDGVITPEDQTYIGDPHPDFLYGGRVNIGYKGFDLTVFVQGSKGNDILMGFNRTDRGTVNKPQFFYEDRWTEEGSTNEWFAADVDNPYIYNSDLMVFNGSYARIKQLQLGYTLPENLISKLNFNSVRVYISLEDYFTFTKYPGLDPEAGSSNNNSLGIDRGVYPVPKKFMTGLSLSF